MERNSWLYEQGDSGEDTVHRGSGHVDQPDKDAEAGKLLAAQNNSALTLTKAGLLTGEKLARASDTSDAEKNSDFKGSIYGGTGVALVGMEPPS
jgi:hypothetical protein